MGGQAESADELVLSERALHRVSRGRRRRRHNDLNQKDPPPRLHSGLGGSAALWREAPRNQFRGCAQNRSADQPFSSADTTRGAPSAFDGVAILLYPRLRGENFVLRVRGDSRVKKTVGHAHGQQTQPTESPGPGQLQPVAQCSSMPERVSQDGSRGHQQNRLAALATDEQVSCRAESHCVTSASFWCNCEL